MRARTMVVGLALAAVALARPAGACVGLADMSSWCAGGPCKGGSIADLGALRPSEDELVANLAYATVEQAAIFFDADKGREDLVLETRFDRAARSFGFVVPVPSVPKVEKLDKPPFASLRAIYTYTEPLAGLGIGLGGVDLSHFMTEGAGVGAGGVGSGGGTALQPPAPPPVEVLEERRVGSFTAFVVAVHDAAGVDAFLAEKKLALPKVSRGWVDTYARMGFSLVAFRYDGVDGGGAGMTSETVRLSFASPVAYFPYSEPTASPATQRLLAAWIVSTKPVRPIARLEEKGAARLAQPWRQGERYAATKQELETIFASMKDSVPDAAKITVQTFRDWKTARTGWGDVVLVPEQPAPLDAAATAARRPFAALLDPSLVPPPPAEPLAIAATGLVAAATPPVTDAAATPPAPAPAKRSSCALAPGASDDGASRFGPWALLATCAAIGLRRRRARAAVATISACAALALVACKDASSQASSAQPSASVTGSAASASASAAASNEAPDAAPDPETERRVAAALAALSGVVPDGGYPVLGGSPPQPPPLGHVNTPGYTRPSTNNGPRGDVQIGAVEVTGTNGANVARVVAGLRPTFRACYNHTLQLNPTIQGKLRIAITVDAAGEATNASVLSSSLGDASLSQCVLGRARRASFDPGVTAVNVPIVFVIQN